MVAVFTAEFDIRVELDVGLAIEEHQAALVAVRVRAAAGKVGFVLYELTEAGLLAEAICPPPMLPRPLNDWVLALH